MQCLPPHITATPRFPKQLLAVALAAMCCALLPGCGSQELGTSGEPFEKSYASSAYHASEAYAANGCTIDSSAASEGYVAATGTSSKRLKLVVTNADMTYYYDMDNKGSPLIVPLNMGNGTYTVEVMQNTTGNNYVRLASQDIEVQLQDEFQPFIRPNVYCSYTEDSACAKKAAQLVKGAENEGDALEAIYTYITENIGYDTQKAQDLSDGSGYIPDPDETLKTGTGICLDYASLAASMLRSVGIPCKIVTGYIEPTGAYHAWNMVYIHGAWRTVTITVENNTWSRLDATYDAAGSTEEFDYTDRYTY